MYVVFEINIKALNVCINVSEKFFIKKYLIMLIFYLDIWLFNLYVYKLLGYD